MMGRGGSNATMSAMNFAACGVALAVGRAVHDGIQRGRELRAVDQAHAVGQRYFAKRLAQRKAAVRKDAHVAMAQLLADRKRIHG